MTRCEEFYEKVKRDGNFCGMSEQTLLKVEAYIEFLDKHHTLIGISERAAQPIMRMKDPEKQAKVIEKIEKQLNLKKTPTADQTGRLVENIEEDRDTKGRPQTEVIDEVEYADPDGEPDMGELMDGDEYPPISQGPAKIAPAGGETMPEELPAKVLEYVESETYGEAPPEAEEVEEEEEENGWNNPNITPKVVKEWKVAVGDVAPAKQEKIPTEQDKIDFFEALAVQAFKWGMTSDEISRRVDKACEFVAMKYSGGE